MCLDISFKIAEEEDSLYDYLPHLKIDPQLSLGFNNLAHIQAHARPETKVIFTDGQGETCLTCMRWGVLQGYMFKDSAAFRKYAFNSFNARAENMLDPKSSWYRIRKNRCLIDAPGIYEHRGIAGWKNKVPYYVRLRNRKRWLLPALYQYLQLTDAELQRILASGDKEMTGALQKTVNLDTGEIRGTVAMITTGANDLMRAIHNEGPNKHRMPLFMQPEQAIRWIDPALDDAAIREMLGFQIPAEQLEAWPVFTIRTTRERPDHREKFEPFAWPGLPELGNDTPSASAQLLL